MENPELKPEAELQTASQKLKEIHLSQPEKAEEKKSKETQEKWTDAAKQEAKQQPKVGEETKSEDDSSQEEAKEKKPQFKGLKPEPKVYRAFGKIPEKWLDYTSVGRRIPDTRFIAFKTPLCHVYTEQCEHNKFDLEDLFGYCEHIGMIVDLTFTYRYYDRKLVEANYGAIHKKIGCGGHNVEEQEDKYLQFRDTVKEFLESSSPDKLVGVHCTHGLNRTGYMVCRYLIEEEGWDAEWAIDAFDAARGHPMERENYKQHLIEKYKEVISSIQSHKEADEIQKEETQV